MLFTQFVTERVMPDVESNQTPPPPLLEAEVPTNSITDASVG